MKSYLLTIILLLISIKSFCANIYVSTTGNDANNGTSLLHSVKSIQKAIDIAQQFNGAVNILIAGGTYFLDKPLIIDANTFGHQLSIKALSSNPVTITGAKLLSGSIIPQGTDELFTKNEILTLKTLPADNTFYHLSQYRSGTAPAFTFNPSEVNISLLKQLLNANHLGVYIYNKWDFEYSPIDHINFSSNTISLTPNPYPKITFSNDTRFRIVILDWKQNNRNNFQSTKSTSVYCPLTDSILTVTGNARTGFGLTVSNLAFKFFGYKYSNTFIEPGQAALSSKASINLSGVNNVNFDHCTFMGIGLNAIAIHPNCNNIKITNCTFNQMGHGAIKIGDGNLKNVPPANQNIAIDNNTIANGGLINPTTPGILLINGVNISITNNTITRFYYSGISAGWGWGDYKNPAGNITIARNHISDIGFSHVLDDMGGIYTLGNLDGSKINNNIISNVSYNTYGANGIYLDQGSSGITVTNNIVNNCQSSGLMMNKGDNISISNNIFYNNKRGEVELGAVAPDKIRYTFQNNILSHGTTTGGYNRNWNAKLIKNSNNVYMVNQNVITEKSDVTRSLKSTINADNTSRLVHIAHNIKLNDLNVNTQNFRAIDTSNVGRH